MNYYDRALMLRTFNTLFRPRLGTGVVTMKEIGMVLYTNGMKHENQHCLEFMAVMRRVMSEFYIGTVPKVGYIAIKKDNPA